jgi:hypothetical protein
MDYLERISRVLEIVDRTLDFELLLLNLLHFLMRKKNRKNFKSLQKSN